MTRRYLVTGAASGLGRAIATDLLSEQDTTLYLLIRGPTSIPVAIASDLDRAMFYGLDWQIADFAQVRRFVKESAEAAPFDGVVHCAGKEDICLLHSASEARWDRTMAGARGAMALLSAVAQRGVMRAGGSVVLISSVAAHRGAAGMAAYSASKGAIEAMARSAARELAPRHIRVNVVAPGAFRSPMHDRVSTPMAEATRARYAEMHPLGVGNVDAVVDAVKHLLSPAARWTTGSTMVVDGGFLS